MTPGAAGPPSLAGCLQPGERVLWQTFVAKGGYSVQRLLTGAAVSLLAAVLLGTFTDTFSASMGLGPVGLVVGAGVLLPGLVLSVAAGRGTPERLLLATDRRLVEVDRPNTKPTVVRGCEYRTLPLLAREHADTSSLFWATSVERNGEGRDTYRRTGLLQVAANLAPAEWVVLRTLVPNPRPVEHPPALRCTPAQWALLQSVLHPGEEMLWVEGGIARELLRGAYPVEGAVNAVTNLRGITAQRGPRRLVVTSYLPHHAASARTKPTTFGTHIILSGLDKQDLEPGPLLPLGRFNHVQDVHGAMTALAALAAHFPRA